jgi:hypothetical protein
MLVNSSGLCAADFPLTEVKPLQLDEVAHGDRRPRDAAVRKIQGVGNSTFVLSVENDNDARSKKEGQGALSLLPEIFQIEFVLLQAPLEAGVTIFFFFFPLPDRCCDNRCTSVYV